MTQLTYEGLIDEFFSIRHSKVHLPASRFAPPEDETTESAEAEENTEHGAVKTLPLSSTSDELYSELRDRNFNAVGAVLSRKARAVKEAQEERHGAKSVAQLRAFVDRLPALKSAKMSLSAHTTLAEMVKERADEKSFLETLAVEQELLNFGGGNSDSKVLEHVEDSASQGDQGIEAVLRVACLQSVVNSGLKPKVLEAYRRLLLQSYGYRWVKSLTAPKGLFTLAAYRRLTDTG